MLKLLTAALLAVTLLTTACAAPPDTPEPAPVTATAAPPPTTAPTAPPTPEPTPTGRPKAGTATLAPEPRQLMASLSDDERACLGNPATLQEVKQAVAPGSATRDQVIRCLTDENEFELYVITGAAERLAKDLAKAPLSRDTKHCMWNAVRSLEDPRPFTSQSGPVLKHRVQEHLMRANFIMLAIPTYCVDVHQPEILEANVASGRLEGADLDEIRIMICAIEHAGGITKWANLFLPHGKPYQDAMIPAQEICGANPPML